ncbi:hypothetical protein VNO77_08482 [Canavalia gladiata]|uniref:Uncharacterized protein n=1 Tax=Canavalia gladiata TaxID=3824 RepID=A0AAN9MDZ4_CANGL
MITSIERFVTLKVRKAFALFTLRKLIAMHSEFQFHQMHGPYTNSMLWHVADATWLSPSNGLIQIQSLE